MPNDLSKARRLPRGKIIAFFKSLPEDKRSQILNKNMSKAWKNNQGRVHFAAALDNLRKQDPATIKEYLTSEKTFGQPITNVIPIMEAKIGPDWTDRAYQDLPKNPTPEDKLYALFTTDTLANRTPWFWDAVSEQNKAHYTKKALSNVTHERLLDRELSKPELYADDRDFGDLAEQVCSDMDLTKEKTVMETLREGIPESDPAVWEKRLWGAQLLTILPMEQAEPEKIVQMLNRKDWKETADPTKIMEELAETGRLDSSRVIVEAKRAIEELAESDEDRTLLNEAALRTADSLSDIFMERYREERIGQEILEFQKDLRGEQLDLQLESKQVQDQRKEIDCQMQVLSKQKSGFFLSKTDTPEHVEMMKKLRLLNAKLDRLQGKYPEGLTEEEKSFVEGSSPADLLRDAKDSVMNYCLIKSKNGTRSTFAHGDGEKRYNAAMITYTQLNKLGDTLKLTDPAEKVRDETRQLILRDRQYNWKKLNVEDMAAKTILAQSLINKELSPSAQKRMLRDEAMKQELERIKAKPSFQKMVKNLGRDGLEAVIIKGVTPLAEAYRTAANQVQNQNRRDSIADLQIKEPNAERDSVRLKV